MFDLLKKKFSSFIGSIAKKEREENSIDSKEEGIKHEEAQPQATNAAAQRETRKDTEVEIRHGEPVVPQAHRQDGTKKEAQPHERREPEAEKKGDVPIQRVQKHSAAQKEQQHAKAKRNEHATTHEEARIETNIKPDNILESPRSAHTQEIAHVQKEHKGILDKIFDRKPKAEFQAGKPQMEHAVPNPKVEVRPVQEERKPEHHSNISLETKIKGIVLGTVDIKEKDVEDILEEFKMALLESDVNYEVAEKIVDNMHHKLVGSKVSSRDIESGIRGIIRDSISEILSSNSNIDIVHKVKEKRKDSGEPFTILFIGPNGAGKTTTMGKLANMMLKEKLTCVLCASDTFRAAAIEQTAIHAQRLGINVVKGTYGADPASIAFDAIAYAKARNIDVVLVDSAGRQETNKNLVEEMKKMVRVAKPDMKIFVGESIAGNALIGQIKTFDAAIRLDGIILTKLDVDAKGGNTISVLSETTIPVLFFGVGEAYDSLVPYDQKMILDNIVPI